MDLAWSDRHPTAICLVGPAGDVIDEALVQSDAEIVESVAALGDGRATIAIDAPLFVPNATGRRPCEAEVQAVYGSRHAGPHPSNRELLERVHGRIRGEELVHRLRDIGYGFPGDGLRCTVLECYPHPAIVEMFGLDERLRYKAKRGVRVAQRREGLARLSGLLDTLVAAQPPLVAAPIVVDDAVRGRRLKAVEDTLDARVCAWVAALWNLTPARVRVFGDPAGAHIAVPVGAAHPTG